MKKMKFRKFTIILVVLMIQYVNMIYVYSLLSHSNNNGLLKHQSTINYNNPSQFSGNLNISSSSDWNIPSKNKFSRQAAYGYALQWWNGRNSHYNDFSGSGGDCANFVSQCLIAGGFSLHNQ